MVYSHHTRQVKSSSKSEVLLIMLNYSKDTVIHSVIHSLIYDTMRTREILAKF